MGGGFLIPFRWHPGFAQEAEDQEIEEIVVTGSHIKGANITGALPVSVISSEENRSHGRGLG